MAKRRANGDGMIRRRADGRWEGRIVAGHTSDGKPIYRSVFANTQSKLMPKLNALKETYAGVELNEDSHMTLGEWLDKWLTEYKAPMIRQSTVDGYKTYINYIKPRLGSKPITQVTTTDIQKMYNTLKESGRMRESTTMGKTLSSAVVRSVHMLLHEAMDSAVLEGIVPRNPTNGTTIPRPTHKEKTVLIESQIETLMKAVEADEIWRDFFKTELMTGMRLGEICGLKWEDFDEATEKLHVRRSVHYEHKQPIIGETKTSEGNRSVTISRGLVELLAKRKKNALTEWIFPNPLKPELPMNPRAAYMRLKKLLGEADLPDMTFHELRHTFATHSASSGIDPRTLASILGHTKASFTLDTYTHITTDMQNNAAEIVEDYITDIFGKELKPWEKGSANRATEH
ncbi:MAG: site-specific integrase [Clostridia bacterium]|nr:site-specific integrase [Clostridia bacterium]